MTDLWKLLAFGPDGWGDEILDGFLVTIQLALATLPFGLAIGFGIALAKNSPLRILRILGELYTTVFRGLPELLTLFIVYYGGQMLANRIAAMWGATGFQVSAFVSGMVALALVLGAFSSEVFLAALRGVPRGQAEAARSLGLSRFKTLRLVVAPQLWRLALPGLSNNWLVLLKDTSLVSVIALNDLMRQTFVVVGNTKKPLFFFLLACLIYLVASGISTWIALRLEARAGRGFVGSR